VRTKKIAVLLIASMLLALTVFASIAQAEKCEACSARPLPKSTAITDGASAYTNAVGEFEALQSTSSAPGYCPSYGGSHLYEYISSVTYTQNPGGTMTITVDIYIANPTGCTYGNPCPEYDDSPEYVNVWVDWDGDKVFESGEKVIDAALTGYSSLNYHGTMTTSKIVTIPPDAVSSTWMRANLGWGHDPNDPCEYSWTWGDVVDLEIEITPLKVCIDPGHGGSDPGAVGYNGDAYPNEEDINLDIALKLKALLEAKNIKVIMTRATDTTVTLQQRCDIANNNNCDIFVSIHCNSHEKESAHGTETYYYPGSVKGLDLANHVQSELVKQIGLTDRGTKSETYYVLKHTNMPAALTEVAFISNQTEFNLLSDSAFRQKAAQGIANGILEYFKKKGLTITAYSPVDLVVTDPDGLTISNQLNEILGATYTEIDINEDDDPDDQIRIPDRKIGDYFITVIPEPDASPTDTYTLEALVDGKTVILAEDIQISDIPSQPYIIESTKLVALTGNYWDYGTDIDSNGVFDYLTVDVEVNPANPGNVVASARLMDSNGEEIIWASNTAWLDAGLPQNIQLNFDGRYIYGNMVAGPYYVRDVYVYHTGDPTLPDYVYDAHTTAAYGYTEFEGSGVITGTVTDAGTPVQNAFISSIVASPYPADKKDFRFLNSSAVSNSNRKTLSLNHDISRFD